MNETQIKIILDAVDNATKTLQDVSKNLDGVSKTATSTQKSLGGLASFKEQIEPAADASRKFGIALLGAGAAVAAGMYSTIQAAQDAQAEMALVDNTLKNSKGNFDELKKKVNEVSQSMIKLGFDDEDTASSLAKLYQRTGDMNEAMKLNQLAMDLSRAKNIDLSTATQMVGMVLSGQGKVLKQYGIDIKESASPMEALNDLQMKVKGSAEAYSQTAKGQAEILKVTYGNLKEEIGDKLLPVFIELLKHVNSFLTDTLPKWIDTTKEIINWLKEHKVVLAMVAGAIVGALVPALVSLAITVWTTVLPAIAAMVVSLAPFMIGGAIIAGIVYGIVWVYNNWETIANKLKQLWEGIKQYFKDTWDGIKLIFSGVIDWIMDKVNYVLGLVDKVKNAVSSVAGSIGKGVSSAVSSVGSVLGFANGGIVTKPTLAMVGEGGESEAIIPLSKLSSVVGGGIQVVVTGNTFLDENVAVQVGDMIIDRLRKTQRLPSRSF